MFRPKLQTKNVPLAARLDPTVELTDEIKQGRRVDPQRSFGDSYGDTRTNFPTPGGAVLEGYPSTETTAPSMGQPTVPKVGPIKPRKLR